MNERSIAITLKSAIQRLAEAGCDTPQLDAEILLAFTLNTNRTWLITHSEASLTSNQLAAFADALARREKREPVAYITGHREFYGLDFLVSPAVLIPRPETELLIETALAVAKKLPATPTIVDVGTGSGCIAITLAKYLPQARLTAIDLSAAAQSLAQRNAARHGVTHRIEFLPGHLLTPISPPVDLIVSNPPYVSQPYLAAPTTMPEVSQFEPRLALDGGPTGLAIIEQLLAQAASKLAAGGYLLMELGADQGVAVTKLAHQYFPQAQLQVQPDLAGLDRLLVLANGVNMLDTDSGSG